MSGVVLNVVVAGAQTWLVLSGRNSPTPNPRSSLGNRNGSRVFDQIIKASPDAGTSTLLNSSKVKHHVVKSSYFFLKIHLLADFMGLYSITRLIRYTSTLFFSFHRSIQPVTGYSALVVYNGRVHVVIDPFGVSISTRIQPLISPSTRTSPSTPYISWAFYGVCPPMHPHAMRFIVDIMTGSCLVNAKRSLDDSTSDQVDFVANAVIPLT